MMKVKTRMFRNSILFLILFFFASESYAHETPADLANLSINELSRIKLSGQEKKVLDSRWNISYRFRRTVFEGYRDGTTNVPRSQVLFDGNPANRTSRNFPIVPTKITQEAHIFNLGYKLDSLSAINVVVPYIKQSTNHISIVPGFSTYSITTEGVGDVVLSYERDIFQMENSFVLAKLGISFPTGSINQTGNTPRGPGEQQLPFTKQLGSGTFDFPIGINYYGQHNKWSWGAGANAKFRLGRNSRNYRLGHTAGASVWSGIQMFPWLKPTVNIDYRYSDHIHGMDNALLAPGAFPFPASITNPRFFGGHKVFASIGFELSPQSGPLSKHTIGFSYAKPIYQNLKGLQIEQDGIIDVYWDLRF